MNMNERVCMLVALLGLWVSGLVACTSAPGTQPIEKPALAEGVVLGTAFARHVPSQWINELAELPPGAVSHVDVVYFHRAERCTSCINAENYTRETLETHFASQLKSGWMSLRVLEMEKPENAAVVQKFDAAGSALYLSVVIQDTEYLCPNADIWFYTTNKYLFVETLKKKLMSLVGRG